MSSFYSTCLHFGSLPLCLGSLSLLPRLLDLSFFQSHSRISSVHLWIVSLRSSASVQLGFSLHPSLSLSCLPPLPSSISPAPLFISSEPSRLSSLLRVMATKFLLDLLQQKSTHAHYCEICQYVSKLLFASVFIAPSVCRDYQALVFGDLTARVCSNVVTREVRCWCWANTHGRPFSSSQRCRTGGEVTASCRRVEFFCTKLGKLFLYGQHLGEFSNWSEGKPPPPDSPLYAKALIFPLTYTKATDWTSGSHSQLLRYWHLVRGSSPQLCRSIIFLHLSTQIDNLTHRQRFSES